MIPGHSSPTLSRPAIFLSICAFSSTSMLEYPSRVKQKGCYVKTIEQLNFFHLKMSHIISLKVTKFQQPLLITLGIAYENLEGLGQTPHRR